MNNRVSECGIAMNSFELEVKSKFGKFPRETVDPVRAKQDVNVFFLFPYKPLWLFENFHIA